MNKNTWYECVLENLPHGEESSLNLSPNDAIAFITMMLKNGYALCVTGGDIGDDWKVSWLYAGTSDNLNYPDYNNVIFSSIDYFEDYPEAYNNEFCLEEEGE